MKKKIVGCLVWICLASALCFSQAQTTVTATIVDQNGIPYSLCTYTATFLDGTLQSGQTSTFTNDGTPVTPRTYTGTCNSSGVLSQALWSNTGVYPSGSKWQIAFCDSTGIYCSSATTSVTGTTQSLSALLSGAAKPLSVKNYVMFPGAPTGACGDTQQAKNQATGDLYTCLNGTWHLAGGGGGGTPGGSNTQLQYNNASAFGGIADLTFDGSHTITLGASGLLDFHSGAVTSAFKPPASAGAAPTIAAVCAFNTTNNRWVCGDGAATQTYATKSEACVPYNPPTSFTNAGNTTFAIASNPCASTEITTVHSQATTLILTNPYGSSSAHGYYDVYFNGDSTGGAVTVTLGSGCTWKVSGGGSGAIPVVNVAANEIDKLHFEYDGTNCYASYIPLFN